MAVSPPYIVALLQNWGNWVRLRPYYGHCYSAEHRYKSPQHWYPPEPKLEVDSLSAMQVERIMRHVPRRHRLALKFVYVYRAPWRWCCQRIVLRYDLWDEHLKEAQQMVANLLTRHGKGEIIAPNSDIPSTDETVAPVGAVAYSRRS